VLTAMGPTYLWFQLEFFGRSQRRSLTKEEAEYGLAAMATERYVFFSRATPVRGGGGHRSCQASRRRRPGDCECLSDAPHVLYRKLTGKPNA